MSTVKQFCLCWLACLALLCGAGGLHLHVSPPDAAAITTFISVPAFAILAGAWHCLRLRNLRIVYQFLACWGLVSAGLYYEVGYPLEGMSVAVTFSFAVLVFIPGLALLAAGKALTRSVAGGMAAVAVRQAAYATADGLEAVLLYWTTPNDPFTMRNLLDGGCCILGRPGSGKSSGSAKALAEAIVGYPGSGGLILSSSPTDLEWWRGMFSKRPADLVVFGPGHDHQYNLIKDLSAKGADQRELAKAILLIGEAKDADQDRSRGGEDNSFFSTQASGKLETAISVLIIAGEEVSTANIHEFILSAAQIPDELTDAGWQQKYHNQCFQKAGAAQKTPIQAKDLKLAWDTWVVAWPAMNDRTRSSIEATITGVLHVFNAGIVRSLLGEGTTVTPGIMEEAKWVFVDMSVGEYGSSGGFVLNSWRYATQTHVTKRNPGQWKTPIIVWADEAGKLVNSHDSAYLTDSRKYGGASIFIAQSMQSFRAAMGGEQGQARAEVLLGCFSTKILHAIGDPGTAEWASKLLGNEVKLRYSYGSGTGEHTPGEEIMSKSKSTFNTQQHVEPVLEPKEFMHGLRTGGKTNNYIADAYIIRTGEPFSNGCSWLRREFSQV